VAASRLAERWGVPHVGLFRVLPSTLDRIHVLAGEGAAHGSVVLAEEQTAGRGRDGRTWHSPAGGVWLAMLLRPTRHAAALGALSIRAGLVLAAAVDRVLGREAARVKWPNDVMLDERKVAGILCEGRWQGATLQWLALGIGVNVSNAVPGELAGRAVALGDVHPGVRRIDLLDALVPSLARVASGTAGLSAAEQRTFAERDWLRGRELRAPAPGRARGVRPDGALLVDAGQGAVGVLEGHVELA